MFEIPRCSKYWDAKYREFFCPDEYDNGLEILFQMTSIRVFDNHCGYVENKCSTSKLHMKVELSKRK